MCSDIIRVFAAFSILAVAAGSCGTSGKISKIAKAGVDISLSVPQDEEKEDCDEGQRHDGAREEVRETDGPVIMNAIRDSETGEMVATDFLEASRVVARFRNVAERGGKVTIAFDVTVPSEMVNPAWQLRLFPEITVLDEHITLDPVLVTGRKYRAAQIRGYERYRDFLASVITDSSDFVMVRQLEIFISRNFPDIYAMKNDTSYVSEPMAESIFGLRQKEVLEHYTRRHLMARNDRRKKVSENMLGKLVGGLEGSIKIDTVVSDGTGEICYRYTQTLESRPGLRRIPLSVSGGIYENGKRRYAVPGKEELAFYISSLSSLADTSVRYRTVVVERNVYDYTKAVIDFGSASSCIDTASGTNAQELRRIRSCMEKILAMDDFVADSVVISASSSPEGSYRYNSVLSTERAGAVAAYLSSASGKIPDGLLKVRSEPENWELFMTMVSHDTLVSETSREKIIALPYRESPDFAEGAMRNLPEYRYFREKLYPLLRTVRLDFHLHRKGMEKDTLHTSVVDSAYMEGVAAMERLDYRRAVALLGKYGDYNSALAYLSSGYDDKALRILLGLDRNSARVAYLTAVALSRAGKNEKAVEFFRRSISLEPSMIHRGRLDPEIRELMLEYGIE
ncbi:MAG: hypothetical protein IAB80_08560 [Bacteroidetes bacterium]|uniref:OmpA-like domain-containing protein n=1 Tax=Candidatus Cryptobacteroides excrementipullorum TaxID=2840761 RepID=A0A9D9NMI0_9BACT|nr:hypothetical protein [Candidatus Cryptobacteroides excrementipullorum]